MWKACQWWLLTQRQFLEEAWSLYGIGITVLFLRFAIRLRTVGVWGFRGDDAFAFLLIVFFTLDAVTVHDVCECQIRVFPQPNKEQSPTPVPDYMSTNVEGAQIQKTRRMCFPPDPSTFPQGRY